MKIIKISLGNIVEEVRELQKNAMHFDEKLVSTTEKIVKDVRENGDEALFEYTKKFDKVSLSKSNVKVSEKEFCEAEENVSKELIKNLKIAAKRIEVYQKKKLPRDNFYKDELNIGLGWLIKALERVGLYIPGGKAAYPSTVLMSAIPAKVAGVEKLFIVTPCLNGKLNPEVLVASRIAGVNSVYKVGGAQAVSSLAFGTESIPKVDKIVGPGNVFVTIAKKLVFGFCDIDMIAGPSEVLVIADGSCPPEWIAADLLAQAEHDEMAVPTLVTTSNDYGKQVSKELYKQLGILQRENIASESLRNNGKIFVVSNLNQAVEISNAIAPEHLQLCVKSPTILLKKIKHAGAIFLGSLSTEAFGDYVCGPSHVLPTGGSARFSSPLSVYDFIRMPSLISMSKKGFNSLAETVMNLAYAEGLQAHALSVKKRVED